MDDMRPVFPQHEEIRRKLHSATCELAFIENLLWMKEQMGERLPDAEVTDRVKVAWQEIRRHLWQALDLAGGW